MVEQEVVRRIRVLAEAGWGHKRIAREVGVARNTVRCYLRAGSAAGIRSIGSLYYLFYALNHGVPETLARQLVPLVLTVVAVSIVVHGISVTPLMQRYERGHSEDDTAHG